MFWEGNDYKLKRKFQVFSSEASERVADFGFLQP